MAGASQTLVESFKGNVKKLKMKELSLNGDNVRGANEREDKFLKKTLGSLERARDKRLARLEIEVKELQHTLVEQNSVTPSMFSDFEKTVDNDVNQQKYCAGARKLTYRLLGLENRKISTDNNPKYVRRTLNMWIEKATRKASTPEPCARPGSSMNSGGVKQDDLPIKQPSSPLHKETLNEIHHNPRRLLLRQRSTPNMAGSFPLVAPPECNSPGILRRKTSSSESISIASPFATVERNAVSGGCPSLSDSVTKCNSPGILRRKASSSESISIASPLATVKRNALSGGYPSLSDGVTKNRVNFSTPDIREGKRRSGTWSVDSSRRDHASLVNSNLSPMIIKKGLKSVRSCPVLRSGHAQQVFSNPARSVRLSSDRRPDSQKEHIPQLSVARNIRGKPSSPDLKLQDLENERDTPLPYLRPHGKCRSDSDIDRREWSSSPLEQHLSDDGLNSQIQERVNAFLASLESRKNDDENFVEP